MFYIIEINFIFLYENCLILYKNKVNFNIFYKNEM